MCGGFCVEMKVMIVNFNIECGVFWDFCVVFDNEVYESLDWVVGDLFVIFGEKVLLLEENNLDCVDGVFFLL